MVDFYPWRKPRWALDTLCPKSERMKLRQRTQLDRHVLHTTRILVARPLMVCTHLSFTLNVGNQVPVIADMASQCRKEVVQSNCMVALVNITCINGHEVGRDTVAHELTSS